MMFGFSFLELSIELHYTLLPYVFYFVVGQST